MKDERSIRVRPAAVAAWGFAAAVFATCAAAFILVRAAFGSPELPGFSRAADDFGQLLVLPFVAPLYAAVGALIVARRANAIGWLFCLIGVSFAVYLIGVGFASYGVLVADARPRGTAFAAWLGNWAAIPGLVALPILFLLFPNGHVPSRWWRPALWLLVLAPASLTLEAMAQEHLRGGPWVLAIEEIRSPVSLEVPSWVGLGAGLMLMPAILVALAAPVWRYRKAGIEERLQLRWMTFIPLATIGFFAVAAASSLVAPGSGFSDALAGAFWTLVPFAAAIAIPIAAAIAILRYRLYDLDVVVRKTVVVGLVVAGLTGVLLVLAVLAPLAIVGVGGEGADPVALMIGIVLGVLVIPFRRVARRIADRLVYGERATPYEVLSDFAERVGETYSTEDVLPRMTQLLATGTGATEVRVWLRAGAELRPVAAWPSDAHPAAPVPVSADELPGFDDDAVGFPVRHQGQVLGAITLTMRANDPMDPSKERLVRDLAGQAGLVLRNVGLIEDLRASRRRIVTAQDERARKLERDIHDGAQQQLVALAVQLGLAQQLIDRDPGRAKEALASLQSDANDAVGNLRDLARGIYPPLLAEKGLGEALAAQARKSAVPVSMEANGVGRYPQDVEAAVYFCAMEALNNVAKYAEATTVRVRLGAADGRLSFEVADDGRGFDPAASGDGTGLQGMADRLDAIGGTLMVESGSGRGTTVTGAVPAAPRPGER